MSIFNGIDSYSSSSLTFGFVFEYAISGRSLGRGILMVYPSWLVGIQQVL